MNVTWDSRGMMQRACRETRLITRTTNSTTEADAAITKRPPSRQATDQNSQVSEGKGPRYSSVIATAGGGLTAAEICDAAMNAKGTAGTHISRRN